MTGTDTVEYELVPPDGGWGWMIVLGAALSNMTGQCLVAIFSILFGDKMLALGFNTTSAAVIMNTMMAVMQFSGLLTGPLLKKFSIRQVAFSGGCLIVSGLLLTSFANSFIHIIITYSIFIGLGFGLVAPSGFMVVKTYFLKARGRAVGMYMSGGNMGQMAMPHVVRFLLENYGFTGTMMVLGAVAMHGPMGSLLFHPLEWHAERRPVASELKPLKGEPDGSTDGATVDVDHTKLRQPRHFTSVTSLANSELGDVNEAVPVHYSKRLPTTSEEDTSSVRQKPEPVWRRVIAFMDLDLLRNQVYLNVMFGSACTITAAINFSLLLPLYLQRHLRLSMSDTALCLTMMAAGDLMARLTLPSFTDRLRVKPRLTFFIGTVFCGLTRSVIATSSGMVALCIWNALSGFSRGAAMINTNLCVAEVCPEHKLPAGIGFNMVSCGILLLTVGPAIGYVRDETGDYPLCIHLLTVLMLVAMTSWLIEGVVRWCRRKR
ncbi:monocarboxylate transporter 2-like [Schistocerca piceifrons]|uniref:monocarboxylate transporter 2-like n=1 Tax=Schistocerca piceifrons TaxID=274613 RepID=UPI001F5EA18F|nr:monocarboxylate transporter 2-like [Schistocerca piceifrons]